jgi:hypothetical protein
LDLAIYRQTLPGDGFAGFALASWIDGNSDTSRESAPGGDVRQDTF